MINYYEIKEVIYENGFKDGARNLKNDIIDTVRHQMANSQNDEVIGAYEQVIDLIKEIYNGY
jgi:hypothetical protein